MTAVIEQPATVDNPAEGEAEREGKTGLGRALDVAGVVAAVALGVILFDVLSGGKLTKWARQRRGAPQPEQGPPPGEPCVDC